MENFIFCAVNIRINELPGIIDYLDVAAVDSTHWP